MHPLEGLDASCSKSSTGGRWASHEMSSHINVLEIKAAHFALLAFFPASKNIHVLLRIDNTTAVAHINHIRVVLTQKHAKQPLEKFGYSVKTYTFG